MKKLLSILFISLTLTSYASADTENSVKKASTEKIFVRVIENSDSKRISRKLKNDKKWKEFEDLKKQIEFKTGRSENKDGYVIFDENWQIKEVADVSTVDTTSVSIVKLFPSDSNIAESVFSNDPYYIEKFIDSAIVVNFDEYNNFSSTHKITRSSTSGDIFFKGDFGFMTHESKLGIPLKKSNGEILFWNQNYGRLDGLSFDIPFEGESVYSFKNPAYKFNDDGTISFYSNGNFIGKINSKISYTYSDNRVKTMQIQVEDDIYNWVYDSQGRIIETIGPEDFGDSSIIVSNYVYDSNGVVTEYTARNKDTGEIEDLNKITYTFDKNNLFESFKHDYYSSYGNIEGTAIMKFTRDENGNVIKLYAEGFSPFFGKLEGTYVPK